MCLQRTAEYSSASPNCQLVYIHCIGVLSDQYQTILIIIVIIIIIVILDMVTFLFFFLLFFVVDFTYM